MKLISIENIAETLAVNINKNYPGSSSIPVLKFGLISALNLIITVTFVLAIAIITGDFISGLLVVIAFPALKYVSGGIHLKSSHVCNFVTSLFMLISIYTPINSWYNVPILNLVSVAILVYNAPSGIKRSTLDPSKYPLLKLIAVLIVSTNFIFQSHVLAVAFLIQALTTTKIAHKVVHKLSI